MGLLRLFYTAFGWVVSGALLVFLGVILLRDTARTVPELAELTTVSGVVQQVQKKENSLKALGTTLRPTSYEVVIMTDEGKPVVVTLGKKVLNDQVADLLVNTRVTALMNRGTGPWGFKAGNTSLMDYETRRREFLEGLAWERKYGPLFIAGGIFLALAGLYRLYRRRAYPRVA
jgi:hypothetical protein